MTRFLLVLIASLLVACSRVSAPAPVAEGGKATVVIVNGTTNSATVYVAFGADSVVRPKSLPFCTASGPLTCSFALAAHEERSLPLAGRYLNATLAFNGVVGCGSTKAELNVNNPRWYDTLDVSLVDGYSNPVEIVAGTVVLGPARASGNEKTLGVFPLGCDICVARQNPPCGMHPGRDGCKGGTQYKPDVPCQWSGTVKGGGTPVRVTLVATGIPA